MGAPLRFGAWQWLLGALGAALGVAGWILHPKGSPVCAPLVDVAAPEGVVTGAIHPSDLCAVQTESDVVETWTYEQLLAAQQRVPSAMIVIGVVLIVMVVVALALPSVRRQAGRSRQTV